MDSYALVLTMSQQTMASTPDCDDTQTDAELDHAGRREISRQQGARPKTNVSSQLSKPTKIQSSSRKEQVAGGDSQAQTRVRPQSSSAPSSGWNYSVRSAKFTQSARPFTDEDYVKYLDLMPEELQEDNIDILIINAEDDVSAAQRFQMHLKKDVIINIDGTSVRPRVKLLEEIVTDSSPFDIDLAFHKSLYTFLFVTKKFCDDTWTLLKGQACLTTAINDKDKKWSVIPILTESKKHLKLPMMLGSLRPINYWSGGEDQFYVDAVRKLLESKIRLILENDLQLHEARMKYFEENKNKLYQLRTSACRFLSASKGHQSRSLLDKTCTPCRPVEQESSSSFQGTNTFGLASGPHSICANSLCLTSMSHDQGDKAVPMEDSEELARRMAESRVSEILPQLESDSLAVTGRQSEDEEGLQQLAPEDIDLVNCRQDLRQQSESDSQRQVAPDTAVSNSSNTISSVPASSGVGEPSALATNLVRPHSMPSVDLCVDGPASMDLPTRPHETRADNRAPCFPGGIQPPSYFGSTSATLGSSMPRHEPEWANSVLSQPQPQYFFQLPVYSFPMGNGPFCYGQPHGMQLLPATSQGGHFQYPAVHYTNQLVYGQPYPGPYPPFSAPAASMQANSSVSATSRLTHSFSTGSIHHSIPINQQHPTFYPTAENISAQQGTVHEQGAMHANSQQGRPFHVQPFQHYYYMPQPRQDPVLEQTPLTTCVGSSSITPSQASASTAEFAHVGQVSMTTSRDNRVQTASDRSSGRQTGSSVEQHIHHHHHVHRTKVVRAENVVIGNKSSLSYKTGTSEESYENDDDGHDDDDDDEDTVSPNSDGGNEGSYPVTEGDQRSGRPGKLNTRHDPSIPSADASKASGLQTDPILVVLQPISGMTSAQTSAQMGFPECTEPASRREPVEVSETTDSGENDCQQTNVKRVD